MKRTLLAITATALLAGHSATWATQSHWYHKPPIVKPPVVTPPVVSPPVVTTPPPTTAAPVQPTQPAQQPTYGSSSSSGKWVGYGVMVGVGVYFSAVIRSHMAWCAEDDKKPARERKCYRPLRDGMPQ